MNHRLSSLTGKELLFAALRHEMLPAVPWVPFAGVHAGSLKGYTGKEILTDKTKLLESLLEVNRQYDPDGQPVIFDLQIEAEILGCELVWADKAPPSVVRHPLAFKDQVPVRLPEKTDGRLPIVLDTMHSMKSQVGDHTALYGLVTGPFTLASHLRGTEIFMDMFDREQFLFDLLAFCTSVTKRMADFYQEAGMDVIAVVDPLVSQISPKHFVQFLSKEFMNLFSHIRGLGAFSSFFVCGDATKNIEVMCQTKPDCIAVDENIKLANAKKITDRYNITIEGNIPLTTCMLFGTQQDNMKYILDLLDELEPNGGIPQNLIISPGCDMPYDIPVENVVGAMQTIRDPESARVMVASYQAEALDLESVILPDYPSLKHPLMEVFTLDSATCPACGYMMNAARRAADELAGQVDMVEYKITKPENVARLMKMGIKNLPSILINGELKFSSLIPSNRELVDELKKKISDMELHLVGGFLGSGKTTAILEAARILIERGQRVGIITNEQGKHLVDTGFLRAGGLHALEVTGGCICCQLDDFADRIEEITAKFDPQVLFAESVGSCADLVATVVKPLVDYRKTSAHPASLSVFSDSRLLLRYLRGQELPFSDAVIYIFEKQIEETDILIANKIDLLSQIDIKDLMNLAAVKYPNKLILKQNSLDRSQVTDWLRLIQSRSQPLPKASRAIDYNAYAYGESRFTWLDRELQISFSEPGQLIRLGGWIREIAERISSNGIRIAHLKILMKDGQSSVKISLTSMDDIDLKLKPQLTKLKKIKGNKLDILINVMAEGNKVSVESALDTIISQIEKDEKFTVTKVAGFTRVPDKPNPTLRIGN